MLVLVIRFKFASIAGERHDLQGFSSSFSPPRPAIMFCEKSRQFPRRTASRRPPAPARASRVRIPPPAPAGLDPPGPPIDRSAVSPRRLPPDPDCFPGELRRCSEPNQAPIGNAGRSLTESGAGFPVPQLPSGTSPRPPRAGLRARPAASPRPISTLLQYY